MTVENTETTENTDLKPLDRQDVFNRVATHLLTQNKKSAIQRPPEKGGEFCCLRTEAKLHGLSADVVDNFPVVAATG